MIPPLLSPLWAFFRISAPPRQQSLLSAFSVFCFCMCGCFCFLACQQPNSPGPEKEVQQLAAFQSMEPILLDLAEIQNRDTLRAILTYSASSYFIYKGETMGYEYELVRRLADSMGLVLKIIVAQDMDKMTEMLLRGEGDIIAHGLTVTRGRQAYLTFTDHLAQTQQMLVQRKPENWRDMKLHEIDRVLVRNPIDLIGKTISVRETSAYTERLGNLMEEIGGDIRIDTVDGSMTTDEIMSLVATGELEFTVADRNIALINAAFYPNLDIETPMSFRQRIAWAVRPNSPELLHSVNAWIASMKQETDFYVIYNKYFKNKKNYRMRASSEYYSKLGGHISPYDEQLQQLSASLNWDWRLLAAQVYQESRFDPGSCSWMGACGLMQLIPATAKRYGITDLADPDQNLRAGTRYLSSLTRQWANIPDSVERLKFILASYNAGPGHIQDACRLAEKYGKDPLVWTNNVDEYVVLKSKPAYYNDPVVTFGYCRGQEPFDYVNEILTRYEDYRQHIN